jgi:carbonic anhydrase/acetyltransferase-like protein (isoleucine patch superfamily)
MQQAFEGKRPQIHADAFVHADSTIIGDVVIGPFATIWPGVVLRGDMGRIVIGAESSVQDGSVVHLTEGLSETIVGARVTVGHRVILHGCVVEDACLIGMGAIVLDNAHIGTGSVVGAGALVTIGKRIPAGSLVLGSPASVTRAVGDKERALIDGGWRTYVDYGRRYRASASRDA